MASTQVEGLQGMDTPLAVASEDHAPPPQDPRTAPSAQFGGAARHAPPHHSDAGHAHALDILRRCVSDMELDLTGLVVVASAVGEIAVTAAALAGARRVIAVAREPKGPSRVNE